MNRQVTDGCSRSVKWDFEQCRVTQTPLLSTTRRRWEPTVESYHLAPLLATPVVRLVARYAPLHNADTLCLIVRQCVRPNTRPLIPCQWCDQHSLPCVTVSVRLRLQISNLSPLPGHEGLDDEMKRLADGARRVRSTEIYELRVVSGPGVVRVHTRLYSYEGESHPRVLFN